MMRTLGLVGALLVSCAGDQEAAEDPGAAVGQFFPNDPLFRHCWGLYQEDGDPRADVRAPEAWFRTTGSRDVVVAILDSGVDPHHPDLVDNLWTNPGEVAENGLDDDGNGYIDDVHGWAFDLDSNDTWDHILAGHGTHVAGIVGASGNNDEGTAGLAWEVSLMVLRFRFPDEDEPGVPSACDQVAEGIGYAVDHGAHIINSSFGFGKTECPEVHEALETANESGVLVVVAAGNSGKDMDDDNLFKPIDPIPCESELENVICVGATQSDDRRWGRSNHGRTSVDLFAPGKDILSTVRRRRYQKHTGSSMAAPFVSGALALMRARTWERGVDMGAPDLRRILLGTVDGLDSIDTMAVTGGRLNVGRALYAVDGGAVRPIARIRPVPSVVAVGDVLRVEGADSIDANGDALELRWEVTSPVGCALPDPRRRAMALEVEPTCVGRYEVALAALDDALESAPAQVSFEAWQWHPFTMDAMDYAAGERREERIEIPGAQALRVHFSYFYTQLSRDEVTLLDGSDQPVAELSGWQGTFLSDEIPGDTVTVRFRADSTTQYDGFLVDGIFYR